MPPTKIRKSSRQFTARVDEPATSVDKMKALAAAATVQGDMQSVLDVYMIEVKENISYRCTFSLLIIFLRESYSNLTVNYFIPEANVVILAVELSSSSRDVFPIERRDCA